MSRDYIKADYLLDIASISTYNFVIKTVCLEGADNMPTRTTVYLDEALVVRARRLVPARGLSQLVNDLLSERVAELEQAELEAQMREGYIATRQDRQEVSADWQMIDGEGWPA
jgi:Arc/MetJ family transcription regulator